MISVVPVESLRTDMSNVNLSAESQSSIGLNLFSEGVIAAIVSKVYGGLRSCQVLARVGLETPEDQALRFGSLVAFRVYGRRLPAVKPRPETREDADVFEDMRGGANVGIIDAHDLETRVGLRTDERPGGAPLLAHEVYLVPDDMYVNQFAAVERSGDRLLIIRALGGATLDVEAPMDMLWSPSEAPLP